MKYKINTPKYVYNMFLALTSKYYEDNFQGLLIKKLVSSRYFVVGSQISV